MKPSFRRWPAQIAFVSLVTSLVGCSAVDSASMIIGGNKDQSLALSRERTFVWESWEPYMTVSNYPGCARRYPMKTVATSTFKVEVYQEAAGAYVLRQGKRWYVAEVGQCQFQQFKEPPPEPGELLGAFIEKDGALQFKKNGTPDKTTEE